MPTEVEKLLAVLAADPTLPLYEEPAEQPAEKPAKKQRTVFPKLAVIHAQKPAR